MKKMSLLDIQHASLSVLKDVHEFCQENKIRYTLFGGTLIGAIRNNGFIPWDDDIDIAMPRPDYDRFVTEYESRKGYCLFSRERQGDKVYLAYARVCDIKNTIVNTERLPWSEFQTGVWIDVFPLDGMPSDVALAKKRTIAANDLFNNTIKARGIMAALKRKGGLVHSLKKIYWKQVLPLFCKWDELIAICKAMDYQSSTHYSNLSFGTYGIKEYCSKDALSEFELHRFDSGEFFIMSGYDLALTSKYGDYMTPPPIEKQVASHSNDYYWK